MSWPWWNHRVSQLCHGPVVTYCMVYHYTKRTTLARLLANEGLAIYVVYLNRYFVIPPWYYLVGTFCDTEFLGMHISCNCKNQKIFIDQCEYLEKVLAHFNVVTNPTHTPLPSEFSFKPNEKQCDPKFCQKYQQLVGSLIYLMIGSRPDIGFTVVKLAQQIANPSNDYYQVGLHLCRYLLATCRYCKGTPPFPPLNGLTTLWSYLSLFTSDT